jgi:DNA-binding CsgD family transcriptional regulator
MANGIGIIKAGLLSSLSSLSDRFKGSSLGRLAGSDQRLLISLDGTIRALLREFAEQNAEPVEEAAAEWLKLQASEYKQDKEIRRHWMDLSDREQKVVALCCLGYSDWEIAETLDIAYGTARTHLYNAIYKLGINKKSQLLFLLRNWDFSKFDRDFSRKA